jgi:hypothetical protein
MSGWLCTFTACRWSVSCRLRLTAAPCGVPVIPEFTRHVEAIGNQLRSGHSRNVLLRRHPSDRHRARQDSDPWEDCAGRASGSAASSVGTAYAHCVAVAAERVCVHVSSVKSRRRRSPVPFGGPSSAGRDAGASRLGKAHTGPQPPTMSTAVAEAPCGAGALYGVLITALLAGPQRLPGRRSRHG